METIILLGIIAQVKLVMSKSSLKLPLLSPHQSQNTVTSKNTFLIIEHLKQEAIFLGIETNKLQEETLKLLEKTHQFNKNKINIIHHYLIKITTFYTLAFLTRVILVYSFAFHPSSEEKAVDQLLVLSSLFFSSIAYYLLIKTSPNHWFFDGKISKMGEQYLSSLILNKTLQSDPWHKEWKAFDEFELFRGQCQNVQKYSLMK